MRKPGKRLGCILVGLAVQIPALLPLIGAVLDMHNRFSITASILFPYAAISDRLRQPPLFLMLVVLAVTALQFPIYGAIIGQAWTKNRLGPAILVLPWVHGIASGVAVYMKMAKVF
jgi:hypothetical protein